MPSIAGFFWPVNFLIKHFGQKAFRAVEEEPGTEQRWSYTASNAVATSRESAPVAAPTAKKIKTVLCHRKQPPRTTVSICSSSCCPLASLDWDELRSLSVCDRCHKLTFVYPIIFGQRWSRDYRRGPR